MNYLVPLIITAVYIFGNFYVFQRIWTAMPPSWVGRSILLLFAIIVIVALFLTMLMGEKMPVAVTSVTHAIGTSWMIILLYLFMIFLLQDIIGLANRFLHFMPNDALTRYTKDNWLGLAFIIGFVSLFMLSGYLKYQWKVRVPLNIEYAASEENKHDTYRIVAISDMHLGYGIGKSELEGWIEEINKENADLILIAGDLLDNSVRPLEKEGVNETLKKLKAKEGVYACLGNHEYIHDAERSADFIKSAGVTLLQDSIVELSNGIYLAGRDDRWNKSRKTINELLDGLDRSKKVIMLDHQPYQIDETVRNDVFLQLSGHTHKGQVWPISALTSLLFELDYGYLKKGNSHFVVSSGLGVWGGKFRIGTQSEYWVINLKGI